MNGDAANDKVVHIQRTPDGKLRRVRPADAPKADVVELLHKLLLDRGPYQAFLTAQGQEPQARTAIDFVESYLAEMAPRNPAERMLAVQMLWQHARISQLCTYAATVDNLDYLRGVNGALDSAMNTYRRQALAWQQLRSPRPVQFIRGDQVNVADQQIVAGGSAAAPPPPPDRPTAELGPHDERANSILPSRPACASALDPFQAALDQEHRAPVRRGQGRVQT